MPIATQPKPGALTAPASIVVPALPAGQGTYARLGRTEQGHLLLDLVARASAMSGDRSPRQASAV